MKKKLARFTALTLMLSMGFQIIYPNYAFALTTGPSQPEVESFEPVGTTEMVNMFTGDFNYNIPLMDVEGYPINIFYHSGVGMEQEASWVGLGWNINVGEINRSVRGLPDDFNGERIEKRTRIRPEVDYRVGLGAVINKELFGKKLSAKKYSGKFGGELYVSDNNYRGLSAGFAVNVKISTPFMQMGVGMGVGSQSGADFNVSATSSIGRILSSDMTGDLAVSGNAGYNTRSGLKAISLSVSPSVKFKGEVESKNTGDQSQGDKAESNQSAKDKTTKTKQDVEAILGARFNTSIPIGLQNYVPVITNSSWQSVEQFQIKVGVNAMWLFTAPYMGLTTSTYSVVKNGTRSGYGYLYAANSNIESIHDFTREKDGIYNKTLPNLPLGAMTYDVYSIAGQGTGGMFRPFRSEIGCIYDPQVNNPTGESTSVAVEGGLGNIFEVGADINLVKIYNEAGPWNRLSFVKPIKGSLLEPVYFKQAGELTYNTQQGLPVLYNREVRYFGENLTDVYNKDKSKVGSVPKFDNETAMYSDEQHDRSARSAMISYLTAAEASIPDIAQEQYIKSYKDGSSGKFYDPDIVKYNRYYKGNYVTDHDAAKHHISEFTQTMPDGRRYIYGIPAVNHVSREVSFAIDESKANLATGMVKFNKWVDDDTINTLGRDYYYTTTHTPAHAHSYLLTSVLSNDYVDILGDGPTDDDLGSFTKFNYSLVDNDYRWRTPYNSDSAQYNPGFWCDTKDGRGNYITGSRQQWHLRTVESKNYIAEFYISKRDDGLGIRTKIMPDSSLVGPAFLKSNRTGTDSSLSYKLDSIRLYNKHDRYLNKDNAVPIKTVVFSYDYSLCPNVPNNRHASITNGKLTLKKIYVKYGNSQKGLMSPYVFTYSTFNPAYSFAAKDRWGNYKSPNYYPANFEYPYTNQPNNSLEEDTLNNYASAWNMTDIKLPSGGKIHVTYESDDYSFVQDKRTMQMVKIEGVGSSPSLTRRSKLYYDNNSVNDYVYFKRRRSKENPNLSFRQNYFEGQKYLYYSFAVDITGTGKFEYIKGYGEIDAVGYVDDNPESEYAYVKLKRDKGGEQFQHPATVLGINTARYYLSHLLYPGNSEGTTDLSAILKGLIASTEQIKYMFSDPFLYFLDKKKACNINIASSWIRVLTPGLTKKGGGHRVKQITLNDNWEVMGDAEDALYGKTYDYTTEDNFYGKISSGVASYEPYIGGDENGFHEGPKSYAVEGGRGVPSIDFYQEEPFGENLFPAPVVGYAKVTVKSIHSPYGRSSQSQQEHKFYTARDFPLKVTYGSKHNLPGERLRTLTRQLEGVRVLQGYNVRLNDMHGKPMEVSDYVLYNDGTHVQKDRITGIKYVYNTDANGELSNEVQALVRQRGTNNTYAVSTVSLGQDIDVTVDSRKRESSSVTSTFEINLTLTNVGIVAIPFVSAFYSPEKEVKQVFKSMVTTKLVQQYGILKSVIQYDHKAETRTENVLYDSETGNVLLAKVSNEFDDHSYELKYPAYLAYEGMRPAYTNTGYVEDADSLVINNFRDGYLYTNNIERFTPGDELLVKTKVNGNTKIYKLWVEGVGVNPNLGSSVNGNDTSKDYGQVFFFRPVKWFEWYQKYNPDYCGPSDEAVAINGTVNVSIASASAPTVEVKNAEIGVEFDPPHFRAPECGIAGGVTLTLPVGDYLYDVSNTGSPSYSKTDRLLQIREGVCQKIALYNCVHISTGPSGTPSPGRLTPIISDATGLRCALKVSPRYKDMAAPGAYATNISSWDNVKTCYKDLEVKVIRSGRRNNLDQYVQHTVLTSNPYSSAVGNLFSADAFNSILSVSAATFTDQATLYNEFPNSFIDPAAGTTEDYKYANFNPFVTGQRGTYRVNGTYLPLVNRRYNRDHTRHDGAYTLEKAFWTFVNGNVEGNCDEFQNVLKRANLAGTLFWKNNAQITKYDVYGNAREERDAIGNYTTAQYGYNKSLPVAVASNSMQEQIFFEGFEDHIMLFPMYTRLFWDRKDQHSPFAFIFTDLEDISTAYPSTSPTGTNSAFRRNGQYYNLRSVHAPSGTSLTLTTQVSHTGNYSMQSTAAQNITLNAGNTNTDYIQPFRLTPGKRYLINFWANAAGSEVTASSFKTKVGSLAAVDCKLKTKSIDGWYQIEGTIDLTDATLPVTVLLQIPDGVYLDDFRAMPVDANMRSFVYDPINSRLVAQLDENHMATFYEYDQEGLLVRTKKETEKGIVTLSESRRSSKKGN